MKKLLVALAVLAVVCVGCADGGAKKSAGHVDPAPVVSTAPSTSSTTAAPTSTTTAKPTTTTTRPSPTTTAPTSGGVSFANCTEAKAAGYHDIPRGAPGYSSKLDRNNDGIACES